MRRALSGATQSAMKLSDGYEHSEYGSPPPRAVCAQVSAHSPTLATILASSFVVLRSHVCQGRVATANLQKSTPTYWSMKSASSPERVAAAPDAEQSPYGSQHSGQLLEHPATESVNRCCGPRYRVMHSSVLPAYGG